VDLYSRRNEQYFAETTDGRIFMIQYMDERIYKTDTSIVTDFTKRDRVNSGLSIYPNPVQKGGNFTLQLDSYDNPVEISLYDLSGKKLYYTRVFNAQHGIPAPLEEGIYILSVRNGYLVKALKVLVN
jgi:hypothetical protein